MHRPTRPGPLSTGARRAAFTLVEVLIVVVILAILAATVLPQFQNASAEAEKSAIRQNLSVVRSQIELYRVQHNGRLPGTTQTEFLDRMTAGTNREGGAGTDYGPYIKSRFPANPAIADAEDAVSVHVTADPATDAEVAEGDEGWWYNSATGEFRAKGGLEYWTL